jgi:hypothetical protein
MGDGGTGEMEVNSQDTSPSATCEEACTAQIAVYHLCHRHSPPAFERHASQTNLPALRSADE